MEPLQRLSQPLLKSPTGARLVLCNNDVGYPDRGAPRGARWFCSHKQRGRFLDNIESTDAKTFFQSCYRQYDARFASAWEWPSVVLMPTEYKLRVGDMSVSELRSKLEKYWGQGSIPGAADEDSYQDMWVPAWAPNGTGNPYDLWWIPGCGLQLDPKLFSNWAKGECAKWLSYLIAKNHTFGVVHAWFTAFLGVTRESLGAMQAFSYGHSFEDRTSEAFMERIKFRMSFDVCIDGFDETVDGIPSLPLNTEITTNNQGMQIISKRLDRIFPRRIWDICANTVIPATWFCGPPCPLTGRQEVGMLGVKPISHAWVAAEDRTFIITEANQELWPIPLPKGVLLEDVRGEMVRLGVRYAWLDVLCLRQQIRSDLAKSLTIPSNEAVERRKERRLEEWKVDVPTIGVIYSDQQKDGLYREEQIVIFMSGLGRPFRAEGWASERHWLRRAWTLQETPILSRCLIAGLPGTGDRWDDQSVWPWDCKVRK